MLGVGTVPIPIVKFDPDFEGVYDNEYATFDMYFASVMSLQFHPGAGTKEHKKLSINECKKVAIDMLKARRKLNFRELGV